MNDTVLYTRSIAADYVMNALKNRIVQAFTVLSWGGCTYCRRVAGRKYLEAKRKLRRIDTHRKAQAIVDHKKRTKELYKKAHATPTSPAMPAGPQQQGLDGASKKWPPGASTKGLPNASFQKPEPIGGSSKRPSSEVESTSKSQQQLKKPRTEKEQTTNTAKVPVTGQPGKPAKSPSTTVSKTSRSWPSSIGAQKLRGLNNPGNWCYRRSALQNLIAVPQLFNFLSQNSHKPPCSCVTCSLRQLVLTYQRGEKLHQALTNVDMAIRKTGRKSDPSWTKNSPHTQEDSHEFLHYLLGTIGNADQRKKDEFAALYRIRHRVSWRCVRCKKEHVRVEDPGELSLNLSVPNKSGNITLDNCLDLYHNEKNLAIRCDKCNDNINRPRDRTHRFEHAPEVLTIQFKRFDFNERGRLVKNKKHILFPETLDLTRLAVNQAKPLRYRLQALVGHAGADTSSGHYIARVRGLNGVQLISDSSVASQTSAWTSSHDHYTPYVLTYIKQ